MLAVYRADDDEGPDESWCDAGPKLTLLFFEYIARSLENQPSAMAVELEVYKTLIIRTPENSGYQYIWNIYYTHSVLQRLKNNLSPFCLVFMTMGCSTCLTNVGKNPTMQGFDTVVAACPQTTLWRSSQQAEHEGSRVEKESIQGIPWHARDDVYIYIDHCSSMFLVCLLCRASSLSVDRATGSIIIFVALVHHEVQWNILKYH